MLTMQTINGNDISRFASDKLHIWSNLIGCEVIHAERGRGIVVSVEQRPNYIPLIRINFSNETFTFNSNSFLDGQSSILVNASLARSIEEWLKAVAKQEQEAERRAELLRQKEAAKEAAIQVFRPLTSKYSVPESELFRGDDLSPLVAILEKLETDDQVESWEMDWLEERDLQRLIALVHFRKYRRENDYWSLVKTCKHLRKANLPQKVIDLTAPEKLVRSPDLRVRSALLTTRGGAFRDLNNLPDSKDSAIKAIEASPLSYHPHNLLGATLYEEGNPSDGDKAFERAIELGASPRNQDFEIRSALKRSSVDVRETVVAYLLHKDPKRYAWVSTFAAAGEQLIQDDAASLRGLI